MYRKSESISTYGVYSSMRRSRMENNTELSEPIKVRFTGKLRRKLNERAIDYTNGDSNSESWGHIRKALSRQKTNIVIETEEEAEAFISKITGYENGRTWMNSNMHKCATRVKSEIQAELGGDTPSEDTVNENNEKSVSRCEKHNAVFTEDSGCMHCNEEEDSDDSMKSEVVTDGGVNMPPDELDFMHGLPDSQEEMNKKSHEAGCHKYEQFDNCPLCTDGGEDIPDFDDYDKEIWMSDSDNENNEMKDEGEEPQKCYVIVLEDGSEIHIGDVFMNKNAAVKEARHQEDLHEYDVFTILERNLIDSE